MTDQTQGSDLPPGYPPPYPSSYPQAYPPAYQSGGSPTPGKSSLPTVSLVLGICSIVIFCIGVVLGAAAVITGIIGRGKAKRAGTGTGTATAGIITGAVGIVVWLVALILTLTSGAVFVRSLFGILEDQWVVAEQLDAASTAAGKYRATNGSYEGLSTERLSAFGYTPTSEVSVKAVPVSGGSAYCVSGYVRSEPGNVIHMPPDPFGQMTMTINGREYAYSFGDCPPAS